MGYGFGRRVLADELEDELHDPLLWHAHNVFVSQWLQTGLVGMLLFSRCSSRCCSASRGFLAVARRRVAFVGVIGIALIVGFVVKNLTDDFLFRSNAKEFWALLAHAARLRHASRAGGARCHDTGAARRESGDERASRAHACRRSSNRHLSGRELDA